MSLFQKNNNLNMRRLIVNADDLGISDDVNRVIEDCICRGLISSSTLMANAPAFEKGVEIAKKYPQISVGVHLNIIEFAPLTQPDVFRRHGIVGEGGNFIDGAIFVVDIDEELQRAVFAEWDAQIVKAKQVGITPTHIDSHQHTHMIPALQEVLCQILEKHGIKKVRRKTIPSIRLMLRERKQPHVVLDKSNAVQPPKRNVIYRRFHLFVVKYEGVRWNCRMRRRYMMTDQFFPYQSFFLNRDVLCLGGESSTIELMCHPGHESFQLETENLIDKQAWKERGYKLITYQEL